MMMATKYLQRMNAFALLILVASLFGLGVLIADSAVPFKLVSATTNAPHVNGVLFIDAVVVRDLKRKCSVTVSRHIFDATGRRIDVMPSTYMPAEALEQLDAIAPGRLRLAVPLPWYISAGPAAFVTSLSYTCNDWHAIRPINTVMTVNFEVLP